MAYLWPMATFCASSDEREIETFVSIPMDNKHPYTAIRADIEHAAYAAHRDQGREYLASMYAQWAAEESALARALMRIEGDAA